MSTASYKNKVAGDYINAATFNSAFDSIEEASGPQKLDNDNFADECIGPRMLQRLNVCSHRVTVENTNALTGSAAGGGSYSGGSFQLIDHGTDALEIELGGGSGLPLNEGDVVRLEWSQYIYNISTLQPVTFPVDINWKTTFFPRWDLGSGYTDVDMTTGSTAWIAQQTARHGRSCKPGFRQQDRRHARGSGVYIVPSGGKTIIKLGLWVRVMTPLSGQLILGQGSITAMIYRR